MKARKWLRRTEMRRHKESQKVRESSKIEEKRGRK